MKSLKGMVTRALTCVNLPQFAYDLCMKSFDDCAGFVYGVHGVRGRPRKSAFVRYHTGTVSTGHRLIGPGTGAGVGTGTGTGPSSVVGRKADRQHVGHSQSPKQHVPTPSCLCYQWRTDRLLLFRLVRQRCSALPCFKLSSSHTYIHSHKNCSHKLLRCETAAVLL